MTPTPPTTEALLATLNRALPSSDDAERGVISYLLQYPDRLETAPPVGMFYHPSNRHILTAMMELWQAGKPVSLISLTHAMRSNGTLDVAGGASGLSDLLSELPIASHYDHYSQIVREADLIRRNIEAHARSLDLLLNTQTGNAQVAAVIDTARGLIEEAGCMPGNLLKSQRIGTVIQDVIAEIEERCQRGGRIPGHTTGFSHVDKLTGGFQPGHVWIFAGMQGDGKSTMMQNSIESAAAAGARVRWYPLEMPISEQGFRMLCTHARVANGTLFSGMLSAGDQSGVFNAARRMKDLGIELVDVDDASASDIFADIEKSDCQIAVVDYLQLMDDPTNGKKSDTRESILASISRRQKRLARRTGKTIVNASQLNDDGKLRECRAIGMDADKVFLIRKHEDEKSDTGSDDTRRNLWCEKNRGGRRHWTQPLRFNGSIFQFTEDETNTEP